MVARRIVRGSARGARVGGTIWACFVAASGLFLNYAFAWWEGLIVAVLTAGFLAVRPWFMGVVLVPGEIEVKGWYGSRRIPEAEVLAIDFRDCISLLVGFGTGFVPFVGKIRMVTIETQPTEKRCVNYLPGTLGRYNTVLGTIREMRAHVGLPR